MTTQPTVKAGERTRQEIEQGAALELHKHLEGIDLSTVFPITIERHCGRKQTAALARKVFKLHGIKGISVTAPNYSMAQSVHIRLPKRDDYTVTCEYGRIDWANDPAAQANCAAERKLESILAAAFPNHDDRSDTQSDYFDYKWSVA